tara:strand:+ start:10542 stop:10745 length:204 start_codon:yes stop_codon:yes gene_type:complete
MKKLTEEQKEQNRLAYQRKYYDTNRDKILSYMKDYYKVRKGSDVRKYTKKKDLVFKIEKRDVTIVFE